MPSFDWDAWDHVDWRRQRSTYGGCGGGSSRRSQEGTWPKVRNLQKLTAPRGALLYPRLSREEFEGRFLGLMPYLELKGEGNHSMAGN